MWHPPSEKGWIEVVSDKEGSLEDANCGASLSCQQWIHLMGGCKPFSQIKIDY